MVNSEDEYLNKESDETQSISLTGQNCATELGEFL
jgi:hypothetical protein